MLNNNLNNKVIIQQSNSEQTYKHETESDTPPRKSLNKIKIYKKDLESCMKEFGLPEEYFEFKDDQELIKAQKDIEYMQKNKGYGYTEIHNLAN